MTEDEMVRWHHQLTGHKFEQTTGDSEGQGNLACCSPWRHRVRHDLATEQQHEDQTVAVTRAAAILRTGLKKPEQTDSGTED